MFEAMKRWRIYFSRSRARIEKSALLMLIAMPLLAANDTFSGIVSDLKKSDLKTKYESLEKIKAFKTPEAAQVLAQSAVREKDTNFRLAVLDQISELSIASVIPTLSSLFRDKNASVRQRTARVIGMLGGPTAEDSLLAAFNGEADPSVKAAITQALSLCGSAKSIDALNAAATDKDPAIRGNAQNALDRMRRSDRKQTTGNQEGRRG